MTLATGYDLIVFDLDGVVYLGTEAVPGAPEAIRATVEGGTPVVYVTNNASRRAEEVSALLVSLGVPARPKEVLTSARAAAEVLADDLPPGSPVLVVGAPALHEEITAVGLHAVPTGGRPLPASERLVAVVQGYGPAVGWADLADATVAIRAGARWVATNGDATLPSLRGPLPGNGSLVAAVSTALGGRQPDLVVGKPQPELFARAAQRTGAKRVLVVGDRLDTDVEGAVRAGMDSLLVLTGVSTAADVLRAASHERPTHLAADCSALSTAETATRIPQWADGGVEAAGWRVTYEDRRLILAGEPAPGGTGTPAWAADAVRALAAGAWAHPEWHGIVARGRVAERAITEAGLDRYAGWSVRAVSGA